MLCRGTLRWTDRGLDDVRGREGIGRYNDTTLNQIVYVTLSLKDPYTPKKGLESVFTYRQENRTNVDSSVSSSGEPSIGSVHSEVGLCVSGAPGD